jgi:hypothetical protein
MNDEEYKNMVIMKRIIKIYRWNILRDCCLSI